MSEELNIDLGFGGEENIRRDNTKLYTFIGSSALLGPHDVYDHVWIEEQDDEGEMQSVAYVFRDSEHFNTLLNHIRKHQFEQHLYLNKPYPVDVIAFEATHGIKDGDLFLPEGWEEPLDARGSE
jgi:hypothetical protein